MGHHQSKYENAQSIPKKLRDYPFQMPTDIDYSFISFQSAMSKEEVKAILDKHLITHPDGRMNRREFCDLYNELRKESTEIVEGLSANVFKAMGVVGTEADIITLKEFFMIYALTSRGDLRRRLDYAFDLYDTNHDNALELDEVREVVYAMLELFRSKVDDLTDIAKDCCKSLKITQVVKKGI
jgi:Ca2+-binding EF-hand superfamily protein